jgi:hypothetical protein
MKLIVIFVLIAFATCCCADDIKKGVSKLSRLLNGIQNGKKKEPTQVEEPVKEPEEIKESSFVDAQMAIKHLFTWSEMLSDDDVRRLVDVALGHPEFRARTWVVDLKLLKEFSTPEPRCDDKEFAEELMKFHEHVHMPGDKFFRPKGLSLRKYMSDALENYKKKCPETSSPEKSSPEEDTEEAAQSDYPRPGAPSGHTLWNFNPFAGLK